MRKHSGVLAKAFRDQNCSASLTNTANASTYVSNVNRGTRTVIDFILHRTTGVYRRFFTLSANIGKFKTHFRLSIIPDSYVEWLISCFLLKETFSSDNSY